jgi:serine/threonine protein phosphatase PrpC
LFAFGGVELTDDMRLLAVTGVVAIALVALQQGRATASLIPTVLLIVGVFAFLRIVYKVVFAPPDMAAALAQGDMLPKPITVKHGETGQSARLRYGYSCMQGWRRTMEDAHTAMPSIGSVKGAAGHTGNADHALFGVFDGHRGSAVATFSGSMLPQFLVSTSGYATGRWKDALVEAYVAMDLHLKKHQPSEISGCTAVSLLATPTELYCANAGDSRCVLCRDGRAVPLSFDHKPQLPSELRRIQRAGSFVFRGRVQGVLALSRAIGDFSFKQRVGIPWEEQAVTCVPEVQSVSLDARRDEFVVLACDGIWDVMSSQDVVNFVRIRLARSMSAQEVCEELMDACLSPRPFGLGCDNMSVILIDLTCKSAAGPVKK